MNRLGSEYDILQSFKAGATMEDEPKILYDTNSTVDATGYDINFVISVVATYLLINGIVAAFVARHNGRSMMLGFLSGFFMGPLGIVAYMIMGSTNPTRK